MELKMDKKNIDNRKKYQRNKMKRLGHKKQYYLDNKEIIKKNSLDYYYKNKDKVINRITNNIRKRKNVDPKFRIDCSFSRDIRIALRNKKGGNGWEQLVGYSLQDLINHLQKLFKVGMTLENYGLWHIDHKIPKVRFKYSSFDDPGFKQCWSLDNLQPLWAEENLSKGSRG